MSRRDTRRNQVEAPGQDSFLDVVANLVGIILILIMVVGTQVKNAYVAAIDPPEPQETATQEPVALEKEAAAAEAAAKAVEKERERETDRSAANNAYSRYLLRGGYISHDGASAVT